MPMRKFLLTLFLLSLIPVLAQTKINTAAFLFNKLQDCY